MMMGGAVVDEDLKSSVPMFARGLPILLVDHDISSLTSISSMLQSYSFNVTTAQSPMVAMSMIRNGNRDDRDCNFKLILAHLSIAKPEDLLFLRALVNEGIPLIILSSDKNVTTAEKVFAEGACFFLEKPIGLLDLKYVWQHACRRRISNPTRRDYLDEIGQHRRNAAEFPVPANSNNVKCNKTVTDPIAKDEQTRLVAVERCMMNVRVPPVSRLESQKLGASNSHKEIKRALDNDKDHRRVVMNLDDGPAEKLDSRKRKVPSDSKGNDNTGGVAPAAKKTRIVWTQGLHLKFTAAVSALGDHFARPKSILRMMNVPGLTQRQVASHLQRLNRATFLQKYKSQVQQINLVGSGDASSLKGYLDSYPMPQSIQRFSRNDMFSGSEEKPNHYLLPSPLRVQEGYLRPMELPISKHFLRSESKDTGKMQLEGSSVLSPESDMPKASVLASVVRDEMECFSDKFIPNLNPMHEMPLNIDTELQYGASEADAEKPSTLSMESSTRSTLSPDIASGFRALQEPLFVTDGYFMNSGRSSIDSCGHLKYSDVLSSVENSDGLEELLKMLENESASIPNPESEDNLDDENQCNKWLDELLQAPDV